MSARRNILICTLALLHLALVSADRDVEDISDLEDLNLDTNKRTRLERAIDDNSDTDPKDSLERVERDVEQEDEDSLRVERDIESLDTAKYGKNKKAPSYRELYKKHFIKKTRDEKEKEKEMRVQRKLAQIKLMKFEHEKRKSIKQEAPDSSNLMTLPFFKFLMQRTKRQVKPAVAAAPAKAVPAVPAKPGVALPVVGKPGAAPAVAPKPGAAPAAVPAKIGAAVKAPLAAAPVKVAVPAVPAKPAVPGKPPPGLPAKPAVPALPLVKPPGALPLKPLLPVPGPRPGMPVIPGKAVPSVLTAKPGAVVVAATAKPAGGGFIPVFGAKPVISPLAAIFAYSEDQSVTEDIELLLKAAEKEMESVTAAVNPFNLDGLVGGFLGGLANGIGPSTAEGGGDGAETTTASG